MRCDRTIILKGHTLMNKDEIKVSELVGIALKYIWIIVISAAVGIAAALWYTESVVVPQYRVQSKYLIDLGRLSEADIGEGSLNQLEAQRQVITARYYIKSYVEILDTMNFSEFIAEKMSGNPQEYPLSRKYSPSSLSSLVAFKYEEESETYSVTVTAFSPDDALNIAKCIENCSDEYISEYKAMADGTLKIIENARRSETPINVNLALNVLLCAVVFGGIAYSICLVKERRDTRIKSDKEIAAILGVSVLGVIPEYAPTVSDGKKRR